MVAPNNPDQPLNATARQYLRNLIGSSVLVFGGTATNMIGEATNNDSFKHAGLGAVAVGMTVAIVGSMWTCVAHDTPDIEQGRQEASATEEKIIQWLNQQGEQ